MRTSLKGIVLEQADGSYWGARGRANDAQIDAQLAAAWALDPASVAGLNVTVRGGPVFAGGAWTVSDPTVLVLADDATNYVERDAAGSVTANVVGFSDDAVPIALILTGAGAIDVPSIVDARGAGVDGYTREATDALLAARLSTAGGTLLGSLLFSPDNEKDLGDPTHRPRTGYFGTSVVVGADPSGADGLRMTGSAKITGKLSLGIDPGGSDFLRVGGAATFASGADAHLEMTFGIGGAAPTTTRTVLFVLNAPSSGTYPGQAYIQYLRAGTYYWTVGLRTAAAGIMVANTDYTFAYGGGATNVASITEAGQGRFADGLYSATVAGFGIAASASTRLLLAASTTSVACFRMLTGVKPTNPVDGDVWGTTAGILAQVNGFAERVTGCVWPCPNNYSGSSTGTSGADNTAQAVKTIALPANSLKQAGDRIKIRCNWKKSAGVAAITGTLTLNGVTISHTTDAGAADFFCNEAWLQYVDNTHANLIEVEGPPPETGALSALNLSGFDWDSDQDLTLSQDAVTAKHLTVTLLVADIHPKGVPVA